MHLFQPEAIFIEQISQMEALMTGWCSPVVNKGYLSGSMKTAKHKPPLGVLKTEWFSDRVALQSGGRINLVATKQVHLVDTSIFL